MKYFIKKNLNIFRLVGIFIYSNFKRKQRVNLFSAKTRFLENAFAFSLNLNKYFNYFILLSQNACRILLSQNHFLILPLQNEIFRKNLIFSK